MGFTWINQIVSAWVCLNNLTMFSLVTWTYTDCFPRPLHTSTLILSKCSSQAKAMIHNPKPHTHTQTHTQTGKNGPTRSESQTDVRKWRNPFTCPSSNHIILIERSLIIFVYEFTIYTPATSLGGGPPCDPYGKCRFDLAQSPCGLPTWTTGLSRTNISHVPR